MDLSGLADFLETQEIGFTSILKSTKNLDPTALKKTLIEHHAKMIMIASGKYPLNFTSSDSISPTKPSSATSTNKRSFTSSPSDDEEDDYYKPPAKTSSGHGTRNGFRSASTPTPTKPKTPSNRKKNSLRPSSGRASSANFSGRMQPGGASKLFKSSNYTQSSNGFKTYDVIDLSSGPDSELEEAKEDHTIEGTDGEEVKSIPVRKGVATRKITPSKKKLATASVSAAAAKMFLARYNDDSEEDDPFGIKKGENSGGQKDGKTEVNESQAAVARAAAASEDIKQKISILEKSVAETQAKLAETRNVLARQPLLERITTMKALIKSNKALIADDSQAGGAGLGRADGERSHTMAATDKNAPEAEEKSLFLSDTPTKNSAKRRYGGL